MATEKLSLRVRARPGTAYLSSQKGIGLMNAFALYKTYQTARNARLPAAVVPHLSTTFSKRSHPPWTPNQQAVRRVLTAHASNSQALSTSSRLQNVLDGLDGLNSKDPRSVEVDEKQVPYELAYARWLSDWVLQLCIDGGLQPSEELRIAARGQHVQRWELPRNTYPEGRTAYLQWREDLKKRHAATTTRLMAAAGYSPESCKRVEQLILKRALRETEGQILEDALCLVFLERQFAEFLPKLVEGSNGDKAEAKMIDILQKSWKKMGDLGRAAALRLTLEPRLAELVGRALAPPPPPPAAAATE